MGEFKAIDHPFAQYWLTILRDRRTDAQTFRQACTELSRILTYEAMADLQTNKIQIETPLETASGITFANVIHVVPILRSGQLLLDGVLAVCPVSKVVPIGLRRSESGSIIEYDVDLSRTDGKLSCLVVDGIIGTGHTLSRALELCKSYWPNAEYHAMCFLALQVGIDYVLSRHNDLRLTVAHCDREENLQGYMLPGIGDLRSRSYNTD